MFNPASPVDVDARKKESGERTRIHLHEFWPGGENGGIGGGIALPKESLPYSWSCWINPKFGSATNLLALIY